MKWVNIYAICYFIKKIWDPHYDDNDSDDGDDDDRDDNDSDFNDDRESDDNDDC